MKKILLLVVLTCLTTLNALADIANGTCGTNLTWVLSDDGTLTISGTGEMTSFSNYKNVPWYSYRLSIKKIIIEDGITNISDYAFYECSNVSDVSMSNSVTSIGALSFYAVSSLKSLLFSANLTNIGNAAFLAAGLTYIEIPNKVVTIGNNAFETCRNLQSAKISSSVSNIGRGTFVYCDNLATLIVDNNNTKYTAKDNVLYDKNLNTLICCVPAKNGDFIIPNNVTTIGENAFYYCKCLTSITIPKSVISIKNGAFFCCSSLKSIYISSNVSSIENIAFYDCNGLASITVLNTTPPICGTGVFTNVPTTVPIYVPESSVETYKSADVWKNFTNFQSISKIASGTCGTNLTWELTNDNVLTISGTGVMTNFSSTTAMPWYNYKSSINKVIVEDGVTSIGNYAFYDCSGISTISLPNSVNSIGSMSFTKCTNLESLSLPNSMTSIGVGSLMSCYNLKSISIPSGITSIGFSVFAYCSTLTTLNIPSTVNTIDVSTFNGCSSLTTLIVDADNATYTSKDNVLYDKEFKTLIYCANAKEGDFTIPSGVKSVANYAFMDCSKLTFIDIPNSVTSIGSSAFNGCTGLTSLTIPNSVTSIGSSAFNGCTGLTSLTIPNSVTAIGSHAFQNCSNLSTFIVDINNATYTSKDNVLYDKEFKTLIYCANAKDGDFSIPSSITKIGDYSFEYCTKLNSIMIPNSVTTIGAYAFRECSALKNVVIPNSVTDIEYGAFWKCTNLASITIPEGVSSLSNWTFTDCTNLKSFTCKTIVPPTCKSTTFMSVPTSIPVYVPASSVDAYKSSEYWSDFTNIQAIKDYNILDNDISFSNDANYQYETVSYSRTFNTSNWQCLYVPMTINMEDISDDFEIYDISAFYRIDSDNDGNFDENMLRLLKVKSGLLTANHPYFIKAIVPGYYTIPSADNILYQTTINKIDLSDNQLNSSFYGNYEKKSVVSDGQEFYTLSSNSLKNISSSVELGAFRWYMLFTDANGNPYKPETSNNIKTRVIFEDEELTPIETIFSYEEKSIEGYYSLDGKKLSGIQQGVSIIKYNDGTTIKVYKK